MHDVEDIIKANNDIAAYRAGRDAATSGRLSRVLPSERPLPISVPLHVFWRGTMYVPGVPGAVSLTQCYRTVLNLPFNSEPLNNPKAYAYGLARVAELQELGYETYDKLEVLFCIEGGRIHAVTPCTDDDLASLTSFAEVGREA